MAEWHGCCLFKTCRTKFWVSMPQSKNLIFLTLTLNELWLSKNQENLNKSMENRWKKKRNKWGKKSWNIECWIYPPPFCFGIHQHSKYWGYNSDISRYFKLWSWLLQATMSHEFSHLREYYASVEVSSYFNLWVRS